MRDPTFLLTRLLFLAEENGSRDQKIVKLLSTETLESKDNPVHDLVSLLGKTIRTVQNRQQTTLMT